ncbi:hypothetical protein JXK06_03010 [Patescibacteria group bacterium]|nr:hypothetical protein [Patescibacteria group bacterium]
MGFELDLSLPLHLSIHFFMAVFSGLAFGLIFKKVWLGLIAGILGGFLIDLDHVLEYFFVFGLKFNLVDFFNGLQFLTSDKIWLIFHAHEYFPLLILLAYFLRKKEALSFFLITLAFAGFVHLISDSYINNFPPKNYSIIYRASKNFSAPELLRPEQWERNLKAKAELGME